MSYADFKFLARFADDSQFLNEILNTNIVPVITNGSVSRYKFERASVTTGGKTFSTSEFTTIVLAAIWDLGTTTYSTISYTDATPTAQTPRNSGGYMTVLSSISVASPIIITANTTARDCIVLMIGT